LIFSGYGCNLWAKFLTHQKFCPEQVLFFFKLCIQADEHLYKNFILFFIKNFLVARNACGLAAAAQPSRKLRRTSLVLPLSLLT